AIVGNDGSTRQGTRRARRGGLPCVNRVDAEARERLPALVANDTGHHGRAWHCDRGVERLARNEGDGSTGPAGTRRAVRGRDVAGLDGTDEHPSGGHLANHETTIVVGDRAAVRLRLIAPHAHDGATQWLRRRVS